jgi:hypothetical protein
VRSSGPTLEVATPFIVQLRKLVSRRELRGLTRDLRPTIPQLAKLARRQIPFMEQARALSSCFNHVVIPWSNSTVISHDNESGIGKVYEETGYGLTGIAGESRSGDANGQYIRVGLGTGSNLIAPGDLPVPPGLAENVGTTLLPIQGAEPPFNSSAKTLMKPTVPCETQEPPDLRSAGAAPFPRQSRMASTSILSGPLANTQAAQLTRKYVAIYQDYQRAQQIEASGNVLRADKLMSDVMQRFRAYDRNDMPAYRQAIEKLSGAGN